MRLRQATDTTSGTETRRMLNHYNDGGDTPSWINTSTDAGSTWTWQRNIAGIDGNLAILQDSSGTTPQIQLANPHGDIIATVDDTAAAVSINSYCEQTEYGTPRTENTTNPLRYGWLGAKQRSNDDLAGLTLMGVRLYNPTTGRFLSTDPVLNGNENAYNYPNDPINMFDLDGKRCWSWARAACSRVSSWGRNPNVVNVKASVQLGANLWGIVYPLRRGGWRHLRNPRSVFGHVRRGCTTQLWNCASSAFGLGTIRSSWNSYTRSVRYGAEWRSASTYTSRRSVERRYGYHW
jgi:RHS repeat-associated protein